MLGTPLILYVLFLYVLLSPPKKGPTKPKNRTNSTKEFSKQFEGVTGHYPVKQGF